MSFYKIIFCKIKCLTVLCAAFSLMTFQAYAEEVVDLGGFLGGGKALLSKPAGKIRGGVVLLTGGDGYIGIDQNGGVERTGNWIVWTRAHYKSSGIASLLLDGGADVAKAIDYMRTLSPKVVVVAMSRGSLKVPSLLASQPSGIVLASSFLQEVSAQVGDAQALPPTLVVHHRQDTCNKTPATDVDAFKIWGGARVRVVWVEGGSNSGDACQAKAYHGFVGREAAVTSTISGFVNSLR
jgi:hypothetical protein